FARNVSSNWYGTSLTNGTAFGEARRQKNSCDCGSPAVTSTQCPSSGSVNKRGAEESISARKKRVQKSNACSGFFAAVGTRICCARVAAELARVLNLPVAKAANWLCIW